MSSISGMLAVTQLTYLTRHTLYSVGLCAVLLVRVSGLPIPRESTKERASGGRDSTRVIIADNASDCCVWSWAIKLFWRSVSAITNLSRSVAIFVLFVVETLHCTASALHLRKVLPDG